MPKSPKTAAKPSNATESTEIKAGDREVQMDRRWKSRRAEDQTELDASLHELDETVDGEVKFNPPRRRKQRRRQIDPTTCERDYNDEEIRFMRAMDDYKRDSGRMFPTCSEILEVVRGLGYIKLTEDEKLLLESIQQVEDELAEATGATAAAESSLSDQAEQEEDSIA